MFLDTFYIPIDKEDIIVSRKMDENGGSFGYIDNPYPCGIFSKIGLREINFSKITIIYGGNGSGKSTLLNIIANKLQLNRIAPYNSGETMQLYIDACKYKMAYDDEGFQHKVPDGSRIITSDDVFDYMLAIRTNNNEITQKKDELMEDYAGIKYGETIKLSGLDDYDAFREQVLARTSKSRRKFIRKIAGSEVALNSNGETALNYFKSRLKNDKLYCLDEPENSLAPKFQMELAEYLYTQARYCGCQLIIATHSPFLLAIDGARIYDLDSNPVTIKKWWELENTKTFFDFFYSHKDKFLNKD